jgi:hypothetical protein
MYHTTGLTKTQIADLCKKIAARGLSPGMRPWPPILGLRESLIMTLTYLLRRNRVQEEIAEDYGVSQPTITRAISAMTPLLVRALIEYVPTADTLSVSQHIIDGALLPCWSWASRKDLYSENTRQPE